MDQDDLDEAMGIFWDYLLHPQRLKELKQTKTAKKNSFAKQIADKRKQEEHCVREFLDWLIELSGMQLDFFYKKDKRQVSPQDAPVFYANPFITIVWMLSN